MENKKAEKTGLFDGIGVIIKDGLEKRRGNPLALGGDIVVILAAFLLARCHIAFGAYPLATAFVSVLPCGVWLALIGAIVGSLTLGKIGIIHAIICVVAVFLRIIISGGRQELGQTFNEPLAMRISVAMIAAFVGGAYEILLSGLVFSAILYLCFSVLSCALFTFAFSGIFDTGIEFKDIVFGNENVFSNGKTKKELFSSYVFQATALLYIFLISLSLKSYNFFGISPAFVFSAALSLLVAKRFGSVRAMAVGFVSSFGISGVYSVAFALVGLGAGVVFAAGVSYAILAGGVLLSVWSLYSGGTLGIFTTLPEYIFASMLTLPILRKIGTAVCAAAEETARDREAKDMVTATALAYKSAIDRGASSIERMFTQCSATLHNISEGERFLIYEEYEALVMGAIKNFCRECNFYASCVAENPAPCIECVDAIATALFKKERLFPDDSTVLPRYCHRAGDLIYEIERAVAEGEIEKQKRRKIEAIADEYEICSRLVAEVARYYERERMQNTALSSKLGEAIKRFGLSRGEARVFGDRKKHVIIAGEDKDGSIVTSAELHAEIESVTGAKLGNPEYYRNGDFALFECSCAPSYSVEFSTAQRSADGITVSGDSATSFEDGDGRFYSLIADGMGSGELAHKTSVLVRDLLSSVLTTPCSKSTAFHILNHIVRSRSEECSTSVDLFDFDLITGEGVFYKCGAAASYLKRDGSIFRIRSETAPIGIMKNIDAERIRVEVRGGDYVVMISDGISQTVEDSAWLLEFLAKPITLDVASYAELIIDEAVKRGRTYDDLSVAVARIIKL